MIFPPLFRLFHAETIIMDCGEKSIVVYNAIADIGKKTGCSSALLDAVKLSHAVNIKNPKDETIPIIEV